MNTFISLLLLVLTASLAGYVVSAILASLGLGYEVQLVACILVGGTIGFNWPSF